MTENAIVIVSRHRGAVEFVARALGGRVGEWTEGVGPRLCIYVPDGAGFARIAVLEEATADDVRDRGVFGNLPLDLACEAAAVHSIVYPPGRAPRGRDFGLAEMDAAGARIRTYIVRDVTAGLAEAAAGMLGEVLDGR